MANDRIERVISEYLNMGDIARMRDDPDSGYMSTDKQIYRIGPDGRDSTRHIDVEPRSGELPPGVSEAYRDLKMNDFIGPDGFDNRPSMVFRDDEGRYVSYGFSEPSGVVSGANLLELYAGEALALQRKAEAGEASSKELELLDAYNEFLRTRTGM